MAEAEPLTKAGPQPAARGDDPSFEQSTKGSGTPSKGDAPSHATARAEAHIGDRPTDPIVKRVQEALTRAGFSVAADGILGPATTQALYAFQSDRGLERTGEPDEPTLKALGLAAAEEGEEGAETSTPTVRPQAISDEAVDDVRRDSLGFRPYVDALVRFLRAKETQPPLAIAVRAPWGHGKTSFMRMIDGELKRLSSHRLWFRRQSGSPRFETTWLNPWKYNTREELWTAYLATVTSCIREDLSPGRRARLWFDRYFKDLKSRGQLPEFGLRLFFFVAVFLLFLWIVTFVGMPTLTATLVDAVFDPSVANTIKSAFGGWLLGLLGLALVIHQGYVHVIQKFNLGLLEYLRTDPSRRTVVSLTQFENELRMLADAKPADLKVVIFIDDLDRCEPHILWEVMVAQQLAVVSSKCIFVLGMDLDIVARTLGSILAEHSQEPAEPQDEFGHGRGYRFLEKIIQTRISIPAYGPRQIEEFVERLVPDGAASSASAAQESSPTNRADLSAAGGSNVQSEELTDDSPELREAILRYGPAYFTNPRRIKRFVNALRLHVYLAQASDFRIEVDQLARFLVLTERWPRLVEDFVLHPDWLQAARSTDVPSGPRDSTDLRAYWEKIEDALIHQDALVLFRGIDAERLRALCNWYGFRHYGEG